MKTLFLDLEETIIDDIQNCRFLPENILKIRKFVEKEKPDSIQTFSFAIWDETDQSNAEHVVRELKFDVKFELQKFKVFDLKKEFLKTHVGNVTDHEIASDFSRLTNKEYMFEFFVNLNFQEGQFILIDDMVSNKMIETEKQTIKFFNIKTIGEFL